MVEAPSKTKRFLHFLTHNLLLSLLIVLLIIVFLPRAYPPFGKWLFPYSRLSMVRELQGRIDSLSREISNLKNTMISSSEKKVLEELTQRLNSLEERSSKETPLTDTSRASTHSLRAQLDFLEAFWLCGEIESRFKEEDSYEPWVVRLASLVKNPEGKKLVEQLKLPVEETSQPKLDAPLPSACAPWWLKPFGKFFKITSPSKEAEDVPQKKVILEKLKDLLLQDYQMLITKGASS